jgi:hypothetical protein
MAEIQTAYVRIRPLTTGFRGEATRQLRPQLAGVAAETRRLSGASGDLNKNLSKTTRGFIAANASAIGLGRALAFASAGFLGGAGLGAAFRFAVGGVANFERELNVLQAVTNASAAQLVQLGDESKRLGADLSLPGASAADAAQAMSALARGGLDVTNTLASARGVLQLAAAAQIENAEAATITARALNSFGLAGT